MRIISEVVLGKIALKASAPERNVENPDSVLSPEVFFWMGSCSVS
jgi:hypothetical protein